MLSFLSAGSKALNAASGAGSSGASGPDDLVTLEQRMRDRQEKFDKHVVGLNALISQVKRGESARPISPVMFGRRKIVSAKTAEELKAAEDLKLTDKSKVVEAKDAKSNVPKKNEWHVKGFGAVLESVVANSSASLSTSHKQLQEIYLEFAKSKEGKADEQQLDKILKASKDVVSQAKRLTNDVIMFLLDCRTADEAVSHFMPFFGFTKIDEIYNRQVYKLIQEVSEGLEDGLDKIFYDIERVEKLIEYCLKPTIAPQPTITPHL